MIVVTGGTFTGASVVAVVVVVGARVVVVAASWLSFARTVGAEWENPVALNVSHPFSSLMLVVALPSVPAASITEISALTGAGISELSSWMVAQITQGVDIQQEVIVTNARHVEELQKTAVALQAASEGLENGTTGDFIAMDIRQGMYHLGNITGDISTDDLLGNIFSKFCIGK